MLVKVQKPNVPQGTSQKRRSEMKFVKGKQTHLATFSITACGTSNTREILPKVKVFHICQKITQVACLEHAILICLILTNTFQDKTESSRNHTY